MLPGRALELLTAYVDGELSGRQRKLVVRLLHKSLEARHTLKELQDQARRIQQLPRRTLDAAFAQEVLQAVCTPAIQPAPLGPSLSARRRVPSWPRFAAAAAVLAVLIGGAIWFANRQAPQPDKPGPIAQQPAGPEAAPPGDHGPLAEQIATGAAGGYVKPVLPDRPAPRVSFEMLAKTQWQEHFVTEMAMQKAVHLDVAVTNQRQAEQRLETVLQNKGFKVERDPRVEALFKDGAPRTEFVIYAENIRPDELAAMLYELGTDERARTSIEALTVSSVTDDDQKRLSKLLGIHPDELREPPARTKELNKFIAKEQKDPAGTEPGAVRAAATGERRLAVVLVNEAANGKLSGQVQYFLNQRRQLQPGALQVIVVVHRA